MMIFHDEEMIAADPNYVVPPVEPVVPSRSAQLVNKFKSRAAGWRCPGVHKRSDSNPDNEAPQ